MSQYPPDEFVDTENGDELVDRLNLAMNAQMTLHSGASEPAYKESDILWLDNGATPWVLKIYDGTDWIPLMNVNDSTNLAQALDADTVDGADAGNANGNVALSNGTVCVNLNAQKFNGRTIDQILVRDSYRNLRIVNTSGSGDFSIDVTVDEIVSKDASGNPMLLESVVETIDIEVSGGGAGGLDTGAEAANTWYFIWLIYNSGTDTISGLFSISSTAPTMPSGYTYKALVGAVFNDSGADFLQMEQRNGMVTVEEVQALSGGTSAAWAAIDLSNIVPSTATAVTGRIIITFTSGSSKAVLIGPASNTRGQAKYGQVNAAVPVLDDSFRTLIRLSQTIYYQVQGGAIGTLDLYVSGWEYL